MPPSSVKIKLNVNILSKKRVKFEGKNVETHSKFDPMFVVVGFHWNASVVSSNLMDVGNESSSGVRPSLIRSNADSLLVKIESLSHPVCSNVNSSRDISCMLGPVKNAQRKKQKFQKSNFTLKW